jgi:hypothetical protein
LSEISWFILALGGVLTATRTIGKLSGAWLVDRMLPGELSGGLGSQVISPGIVGLGFALNVAIQEDATQSMRDVLSIVIIGFLAAEALSLLIVSTRRSA